VSGQLDRHKDQSSRFIEMIFAHRKLPSGLLASKKVLDIGCGRKKLSGAIGVDRERLRGVDVVADLNDGLPFGDGEFDAVHADQVLEHVRDLVSLVYEVHRILRPGGVFLAHVPYFRSSWAHIDPTHVRSFTINSMDYFVRGTFCYEGYRFRQESFSKVEVFLDTSYPSTLGRRFFSTWALRAPFRFENSPWSALFAFEQISYLLHK
jgi:SAM-dependent methyltransferase